MCRINQCVESIDAPPYLTYRHNFFLFIIFLHFFLPLHPLQCSVSCGNGVKEQRPMCQSVTGGVASTSCDPAQRPPVLHRNCSSSPCVIPPTSSESQLIANHATLPQVLSVYD